VGYSASFQAYFQQFSMHQLFYMKKYVGLCCAIPCIKPYGAVIKQFRQQAEKM